MIAIRKNTFETNSSSCHVITFNNNDELNLNDVDFLEATASGEYCGSSNYQFDEEYDYKYDAGDYLKSPQEKFDYALVCFVEYLNRKARKDDKISWYESNPDKKDSNVDSEYRMPLPEEVYIELCKEYNDTRDHILETFKNRDVVVNWNIPEPSSLEEINTSCDYTGTPWIRDFIEIDGYIDHSSSVIEDVTNAWELAEMCKRPEELFDFVFRPSNKIFIQYNG